MTATGTRKAQIMDYASMPQILPAFGWVTIFRCDINTHESAILALVGAGGIGLQSQASQNVLARPEVIMIYLVMLGTVVVSE